VSKSQSDLEPRQCPVCEKTYQPYRAHQRACGRNCRAKLPDVRAVTKNYFARADVREKKNAVRRVENNPARREVNRRAALQRYGVTIDQYDAMLTEQDGRCRICGDPPDPNGKRAASRLHVDHDHVTGKVRGLLCLSCNVGVGHFRDDLERLRAAVAYIERHRST
jgi:hypothetical protein